MEVGHDSMYGDREDAYIDKGSSFSLSRSVCTLVQSTPSSHLAQAHHPPRHSPYPDLNKHLLAPGHAELVGLPLLVHRKERDVVSLGLEELQRLHSSVSNSGG